MSKLKTGDRVAREVSMLSHTRPDAPKKLNFLEAGTVSMVETEDVAIVVFDNSPAFVPCFELLAPDFVGDNNVTEGLTDKQIKKARRFAFETRWRQNLAAADALGDIAKRSKLLQNYERGMARAESDESLDEEGVALLNEYLRLVNYVPGKTFIPIEKEANL